MFSNFTRKLTAFALLVWAVVVVAQTLKGGAVSLMELATSAGIIIGVAAAKSIGTDAVKPKPCPPTQ
jgi:hypothetical protein